MLSLKQFLVLFLEAKLSAVRGCWVYPAPVFYAPPSPAAGGNGVRLVPPSLQKAANVPWFSLLCQRVCVWKWTSPSEKPMCSTELRPEFGHQVSDRSRGAQRSGTGLDWAAPSSPAPSCTPVPPSPLGLLVGAGWGITCCPRGASRGHHHCSPAAWQPWDTEGMLVGCPPPQPWLRPQLTAGKAHSPAASSLLVEERAQLWCFTGNLASVFSSVQVAKRVWDKSRCFA